MRSKKPTKKEIDKLWADCVKARAGYKSEISGKEGRQIGGDSILHAHHCYGKATYRMRWDLDNGVCLTAGEHKYGVHVQGRKDEYEQRIADAKGTAVMNKLRALSKFKVGGTDMFALKLYFGQELKKTR